MRDWCSGAYTRHCGAVDAAILLPPSKFQLNNRFFNDLGSTMQYASELAFSGTIANKAWAAPNPDVPKCVPATHSKGNEYFYSERSRVEVIQLLIPVSGHKVDDDALVSLADLLARGNIERFRLPVVAQLSD